ncbi:MAG: hypothetical protein EBT64_09100, partial [Gammaproteobacteria bacterium]|nr:hypothetical protein [Gammaproteobacteria bacterium]
MARDAPSWDQRNTYCPIDARSGNRKKGESVRSEANHLVRFTRAIKDAYGPDERAAMLEMLWEVAYADGVLHQVTLEFPQPSTANPLL